MYKLESVLCSNIRGDWGLYSGTFFELCEETSSYVNSLVSDILTERKRDLARLMR